MTKDEWYRQLFERLDNSKFRSSFHLKQKDIDYINKKGLETIRQHAKDFITKREAPAYIANDGKQTPMRGHPVFIAQHATATCCRECIRKWHKMQPGKELSQVQQDYLVDVCGGGAAAWRFVAIIYALIGLVVNTISGLSVKELPEEELNSGIENDEEKKYGLVQAFKLLVKNKYYMMICGTYILQQLYSAMIGAGIYYCTWVLKNKNLFGVFAWAVNIPLIIALIFTPTLVGKWKGMYKLNKRGYILATIARALVIVAGYMGSVPLMMLFTAVAALGQGPWQGDMNAVIAECSEYTYLTQGKRVDGTMYSCTSLGIKIGGGIGTAIVGWLLEISGYVGTNATQPTSAITMLQVMYLWLPFVFEILITILLSKMNVEAANEKLRREKGIE